MSSDMMRALVDIYHQARVDGYYEVNDCVMTIIESLAQHGIRIHMEKLAHIEKEHDEWEVPLLHEDKCV